MCDYCKCRPIPEIADLGAEHERIEQLADEVLAAVQVLKDARWEAMAV